MGLDFKTMYVRLFELSKKVRHHQRQYFRFRASVDLDKAKYYEKQLDALIKEELNQKDSQQTELF